MITSSHDVCNFHVDEFGFSLDDELKFIERKAMFDPELIPQCDGAAQVGVFVEVDVEKSGLFAQVLEGDLVACEVAIVFIEGFLEFALPDLIEEGGEAGMEKVTVGFTDAVLEKFDHVLVVFRGKGIALAAESQVVELLRKRQVELCVFCLGQGDGFPIGIVGQLRVDSGYGKPVGQCVAHLSCHVKKGARGAEEKEGFE
jgi:hypothetical protein